MTSDTNHDARRDTGGDVPLETWTVAQLWPQSATHNSPCLVQIYPTGEGMAARFTLGDMPVMLGRGKECHVCTNDGSVSRRHVRIMPEEGGYVVHDLASTNGTFINNTRVSQSCKINDGDYLRVGKSIFRFLASGNVEAEYHEEIHRLTIVDPLTDIANKRFFLECLNRELLRAAQNAKTMALIMFDIDHFKAINDELGHLAGDLVLRDLAGRVKQSLHATDVVFARYGGEEFALIVPETDYDAAVGMAEGIRALIESHPFEYEGRPRVVTVSVGVAVMSCSDPVTSEEIIQQADEQLYLAKRNGRNRTMAVTVAGTGDAQRTTFKP